LSGTGFVPASQVTWTDRGTLTPVTATATQLTVDVPAGYLTTAGAPIIAVINPAPGGGTTSGLALTIADPSPATPTPPGTGTSAPDGGGGSGGGCGQGVLTAAMLLILGLRRKV
jgi:hypothetical protein